MERLERKLKLQNLLESLKLLQQAESQLILSSVVRSRTGSTGAIKPAPTVDSNSDVSAIDICMQVLGSAAALYSATVGAPNESSKCNDALLRVSSDQPFQLCLGRNRRTRYGHVCLLDSRFLSPCSNPDRDDCHACLRPGMTAPTPFGGYVGGRTYGRE